MQVRRRVQACRLYLLLFIHTCNPPLNVVTGRAQ